MSLKTLLPNPSLTVENRVHNVRSEIKTVKLQGPPPYGSRDNWVPRNPADFGDGGAFPEIHVAQYPLDMGREKDESKKGTIAMQVDAQGKVKYDALVRQGHGKDRIVYSKPTDLLPKTDGAELDRPDEEEVKKQTEETRCALEKLINAKIAAAQPNKVSIGQQEPPKYIRYTPSQQGVSYNSGAKQRVIRMVEAQKDPMEPPRFKTNKKIPRGPPSPPAPVLHSPTRKVTVKEQQEWKIPPCISNWKNARGYTIPLDKRLAADGRGLQDNTINDNFAKLAEALYIADRKAREAVDMRASIEKAMAAKEKESQEQKLRLIAQRAREERSGIIKAPEEEEEEEALIRDDLRVDRHRERERERRIRKANPGKAEKMLSMEDRDITEKIALGVAGVGKSELYDQRLFNASSGLDSGYALDDDQYNVYDQAWRKGGSAATTIYKPKKDLDKDIYGDSVDELVKNKRFVADKEFGGTDHSRARDGPVQFQKDLVEEDPFGLTQFLNEAKNLKRSRDEDSRPKKKTKG